MPKTIKIIVEAPKKRIPVAKKPPKIEDDKKVYNRKKEKKQIA